MCRWTRPDITAAGPCNCDRLTNRLDLDPMDSLWGEVTDKCMIAVKLQLSYKLHVSPTHAQNSIKTCHMFGSEVSSPLKIGASKPPIFNVFRRLRNLRATITATVFGMTHDIDTRKTTLETTVSPTLPKI